MPYASVVDVAATFAVAVVSVVVLPDDTQAGTHLEGVLPVVAFLDTLVPDTSVPVVLVPVAVAASFAAVAVVAAAMLAFVAVAVPVPVVAAPIVPPVQPPPPSASSLVSSFFSVAPRLPYPAVAEDSVVAVVVEGASVGTVAVVLLVPVVQGTMVSSA